MSMSMSEDASSSSSTLKQISNSKVPATAKSITESDNISPILSPLEQTHISNLTQGKRRRASLNKRLIGRTSVSPTQSPELFPQWPGFHAEPAGQDIKTYEELHGNLMSQLSQWLRHEKEKRGRTLSGKPASSSPVPLAIPDHESSNTQARPTDTGYGSDTDTALEKLESILKQNDQLAYKSFGRSLFDGNRSFSRRKSSKGDRLRRLSHTAGSSDTDYYEGDAIVPDVDAILDNTKTLGFAGGAATSELDLSRTTTRSAKEESWLQFKNEIIRLTHTLRIKGWRRVPLGAGADINVQRLSGALTNAVYVVYPPKQLPAPTSERDAKPTIAPKPDETKKSTPRKLLLRVYGPQVDHLIDREAELLILKRLARKNIGPRLLGTFKNGRFEEYLNAITLTPEDLRKPDTYKQIAKRMRELHDGVDLLDRERDAGPFVWQNWDKWVSRCGEVITWVDEQIKSGKDVITPTQSWKSKGFACGAEWAKFRKAVEMYRKWLTKQYGGERRIKSQLVFSHNDTQYGNLLRLVPSGESPLLMPANEHKQLVVIDFEYSNANLPGLEFANHFTEWCYNYHSQTQSYVCNTSVYPSIKDQQVFLQAYVKHLPRYGTSSPISPPFRKSSSNISNFMLDSRGPPGQYDLEEAAREEYVAKEVERLMKETRLWRVANSAQWVAWGIVQAKIPGMEEALAQKRIGKQSEQGESSSAQDSELIKDSTTDTLLQEHTIKGSQEGADKVEETEIEMEEEFDYLAYAQQRAFFFWGDLLELGLIKEEDVPENVLREAKRVPY